MQLVSKTKTRGRSKRLRGTLAVLMLVSALGVSSVAFTVAAGAVHERQPRAVPSPAGDEDTSPDAAPSVAYDGRGKRDPFVSPLRTEERDPLGLDVDTLELRGIVETQAGFTAMLQGPDRETYFVKKGERFFNGTLEAINGRSLTFRVPVTDPLGIDRVRRVVLELYPAK